MNDTDVSLDTGVVRALSPQQKERLAAVLDQYLQALESGVPLRQEDLLQAYPDLTTPLRVYLDSLNALHAAAAGFAPRTDSAVLETHAAANDRRQLGDFEIIREIGRGGMGVVYEADQLSLGRRVALKVLPFAAVLDSRQIARFRNEAQAASQLDHPNIVPVYAVGVERGVHYYAMQLIDGQPLDLAIAELRTRRRLPNQVIDASRRSPRSLSHPCSPDGSTCRSYLTENSAGGTDHVQRAVQLGIQAAEALQAAHEYGVVHRDIKPSNLLVDGEGKLWVTDFGLARCERNASLTKSGDLVGTLRYMSPEQALGQSALVDHRTDIYSLGATLYELLTLRPAFRGHDGPTLLRRIEQQEPPRLRKLWPQIPEVLENVICKAMSKRREDRYDTAREFADDLQCVLTGRPTRAKRATLGERLNKWTRHHQRAVLAVAAASLLAAFGLTLSTLLIAHEKAQAERNYERAQVNFEQARRVVDRFGTQLAEHLAQIPGAEQIRQEVLRGTLDYYRGFVEQAGDDAKLQTNLGLTYSKIGAMTELSGALQEAITAQENSRQVFLTLVAREPDNADHHHYLAMCENNLALLMMRCGRLDEAKKAFHSAIDRHQQLLFRGENAEQIHADLALFLNNLGLLQLEAGSIKPARLSFKQAIEEQQHLVARDPENTDLLRHLAASFNNLAAACASTRPGDAVGPDRQALALQERIAAACPTNLEYQHSLALTYSNLGAAQARDQLQGDALQSFHRAIDLQQGLTAATPTSRTYRHGLAISYNNLGNSQCALRQFAAAESSFRQALQLQEELSAQKEGDVTLCSSLGGSFNNLGVVLEEQGRTEEAATAFRQAIAHQKAAFLQTGEAYRYRVFLSKHYYNYGRVLGKLGARQELLNNALARRELWSNDAHRLFSVAEELAAGYQLPGERKPGDWTEKQAAALVTETLQRAVQAGLQLPADLGGKPPFAGMKDRLDVASLLKK